MAKPDYEGGSVVNLMVSLRRALGRAVGGGSERLDSLYPTLRLLPVERVAEARQVVLLLIDGLGYDFLKRHGRRLVSASCDGPAAAGRGHASGFELAGPLTSVFPTATAPAITTLLTGTAPQQHAITGWHMYLRELDAVVAMLPFRPRPSGPCLTEAGVAIESLVGRTGWADGLALHGCVVGPAEISSSAFNVALSGGAKRIGTSDLPGCFAAIAAAVRERHRYVYAYWPGLDAISHQCGSESRAAIDHWRRLERCILRLTRELAGSGTLLVVTADHGFIDLDPGGVCWLHDHPELAECLARPICGEPRAAFLYAKRGKAEQLERYVADRLAERFELIASDRLIAEGWLGLGDVEPRLRDRLGDYVLLGKGRNVIKDVVAGEGAWRNVGVHGGVSDSEMHVPLLLWQG